MLVTEVNESLPGGSSLLRNEPVQARSNARLTGLLDAAAAIIDEIGFERLTTAMVAERAGASIGTVYRYFPDRIAVVEALSIRGSQRLVDRIAATLAEAAETAGSQEQPGRVTVPVAVQHVVDALVEMYRTEPGFRAIRFTDSESTTAGDGDERPTLAAQLAELLCARIGVERSADADFAIEVATETAGSLIARAFATDIERDGRFVDEARTLVTAYLEGALPA
ncbi:TetR/AcrR family transcriptional regulator [Frondihabitans australicus]|uniref:TetR family transcriptional regulator n=1 Tax=Frondihabitans australicus TaxID=386892 RepID=A0A495IDY5_9MICO|nr:TetR/AcrR family transcriptional regulator [Frondihabitans australicus]RKR73870.1 TetR family transcriptional regulator [Frondihabitans australicus]